MATSSDAVPAAIRSLKAADRCYDELITHDLCEQFLDAWRADLGTWTDTCTSINSGATIDDAMKWLSPESWQTVRWRSQSARLSRSS